MKTRLQWAAAEAYKLWKSGAVELDMVHTYTTKNNIVVEGDLKWLLVAGLNKIDGRESRGEGGHDYLKILCEAEDNNDGIFWIVISHLRMNEVRSRECTYKHLIMQFEIDEHNERTEKVLLAIMEKGAKFYK